MKSKKFERRKIWDKNVHFWEFSDSYFYLHPKKLLHITNSYC